MNVDLSIDTSYEIKHTTTFLSAVLNKHKKKKFVIASSGGIDSSVSVGLCVKAVGPKNVYVLSLPYMGMNNTSVTYTKLLISHFNIPSPNFEILNIANAVNQAIKSLDIPTSDYIRRGNIMARMRMIYLYDRAKAHEGLVCGTENRTEYYLGYFTRFGDEASDIEPIQNLYKTQVYLLSKELAIPQEIINEQPTAGLWKNQTDEEQLGFSYEEADKVLYLHFDKQMSFNKIPITAFPNRDAIKKVIEQNAFKHHVPYMFNKTN